MKPWLAIKIKYKIAKFILSGLPVLAALSLIIMGGLVWLDNGHAFIPNSEGCFKSLTDLSGGNQVGATLIAAPLPYHNHNIVSGNGDGDGDDNKDEPFEPEIMLSSIEKTPAIKVGWFQDRYLTKSYLDFGQFKIAPAIQIIKNMNKTLEPRVGSGLSKFENAISLFLKREPHFFISQAVNAKEHQLKIIT